MAKLTLKEYWGIVAEWKKLYGVPEPRFKPVGFTKTIRVCKRCNKTKKKMHRHHKGNDFFFARRWPDRYAARYIQFHPDDIDILCNACHAKFHKHVNEVLNKRFNRELVERLMKLQMDNYNGYDEDDALYQYLPQIPQEWTDKWKADYLKFYNNWLNPPKKKKGKQKTK